MKRKWSNILDFLFPIECAGCGHEGEWLCERCFSKIEFNKKQKCPLCGRFFKFGYSCVCDGSVDVYITFINLKDNQQVAELIHLLKYNFIEDAAEELAKVAAEFFKRIPLRQLGGQVSPLKKGGTRGISLSSVLFRQYSGDVCEDAMILIPVPLHKRRLLWRGFNQSELILRLIENRMRDYEIKNRSQKFEIGNLKLEIFNDILVRKKNTFFQGKTKMREKDRIANMKDAFEIRDKRIVEKKTVILFDDVITTGSTMEECARVLKEAGAIRVISMAIGKG